MGNYSLFNFSPGDIIPNPPQVGMNDKETIANLVDYCKKQSIAMNDLVGLMNTMAQVGFTSMTDGSNTQNSADNGTLTFAQDGATTVTLSASGLTISSTDTYITDLADMDGDLGDIADGGGFAKTNSTVVSAGKIQLSQTAQFVGTLSADKTVAKCPIADADNTDNAFENNQIPYRLRKYVNIMQGDSGLILAIDGLGFYDDVCARLYGSSASGTFILGEKVTQSTSGAWGMIGKITTNTDFSVLKKSAASFSTSYVVTGAISGATMTPNLYAGGSNYSGLRTYITATGNFFFDGDASNYIMWDGSTLTVRGAINANDITAGTVNVARLNITTLGDVGTTNFGSSITAGTFTGVTGTFESLTAKKTLQIGKDPASGACTVISDASGNVEMRMCYSDGSGNQNILTLSSDGLECFTRYSVSGYWPTTNNLVTGVTDNTYRNVHIGGTIFTYAGTFSHIQATSYSTALVVQCSPVSTPPTALQGGMYYDDDDEGLYLAGRFDGYNLSWCPVAFSYGSTGGSGSAGAGKQYVPIRIGATTYKVLHDGTV